jgi:nucleotide-binding universal stress UspA family protein
MLAVRTILHPTDFSGCSRQAFRLAAVLARQERARLVVLHVKPPDTPTVSSGNRLAEMQPEEHDEKVREVLGRFRVDDPTVTVEHRVAAGNAARVILEQADKSGCDLIVMGTHGRTGPDRLLLGSVAEQVLCRAHCPVLTVRASRRRDPQAITLVLRPGCRAGVAV